ncbi:MAG TPA: PhoH family protein [Elusimicrobiota bacterium]|nr:PhoH family protein [Elusimicrobiota bacterium]
MVTKRMALQDQEEAVFLFGPHDKNLKELERRFGVQVFVRPSSGVGQEGLTLAVRGRSGSVDHALAALKEMKRRLPHSSAPPAPEAAVLLESNAFDEKTHPDAIFMTITGRPIRPMTPQQKLYVEAIRTHDMVMAIGPAGTGKTYLAVASAMAAYKSGRVSRIVLTRPVVEAGEKLGFLPGDFYSKVHPYLKPLYDAFYGMVGPEEFRLLRDEESIEIIPLAYMRGRTLDDAFIILDEAQNTTPEQMKMFLTRMGNGSRVIITGDITQIDLEDKSQSGLVQISSILKHVEGIGFVWFTEGDIVRHGLVKKIIRAYNDWENRRKGGHGSPAKS